MIRLAPAVVGYPDDVLSRAERFGASLVVPTVLPGNDRPVRRRVPAMLSPCFFQTAGLPQDAVPRSLPRPPLRTALFHKALFRKALFRKALFRAQFRFCS
jgi:hypothetical protein